MEKRLKPNKVAFIASKIFTKIIFVFIIIVAFYILFKFAVPEMSVGIFLFIAFVALSLAIYALELIVYKKLSYIFYDNKIVQKGGSLFTNYETELNIKNITHLKLRLPFFENKIFGTGHIDIESAGSSASEIHLRSIGEHKEIHSLIVERMQKNGFNLDKGELAMVEKPNGLGVFFEVFKSFVVGLFVLSYVVNGLLYDEDGDKNEIIYDKIIDYIFPIVGLGIAIVFVIHIFKFLDLKKRVYKIYQNTITYKEGFLSKNYSLLPFENLTDSGVTQTIVDKIFGLYDVKISCQGSSHEILFKNISNGKEMSDKLDALIADRESGGGVNKNQDDLQARVVEEKIARKHFTKGDTNYDCSYTKEFSMDYNRTVKFPLLVLPASAILFIISLFVTFVFVSDFSTLSAMLFFVSLMIVNFVFGLTFLASLLILVVGYIKYKTTKFYVGEKSIQYKYNFLNSREVEFNSDKVTGVMISRSFIDEWFNTMSINFWSIGASCSLIFSNIKKDDKIIENIVSKFGIGKEDEIFSINSEFSLSEYLKSALPGFLFFSLIIFTAAAFLLFINIFLAIGLIVVVGIFFGLYYFYNKECYKRTKMVFCKTFVYYQRGWLFRKFYYAKYGDIKDIMTVRYPFSNEGKIKFNVAGEHIMQSGNRGARVISNCFVMDYVMDIREKDELIDYIFYKTPSKNEIDAISASADYQNIGKPSITVKPSLKNIIIPFLFVLIPVDLILLLIILPLCPPVVMFIIISVAFIFNILLLLFVYLPTKMTTYILDGYRVLSKSGVIFKKQTSIIYDKIDFINNSQGLLNKLFKNGNVTVNTVGSSRTELNVKNIPGYLEFYKNLKSKYEED